PLSTLVQTGHGGCQNSVESPCRARFSNSSQPKRRISMNLENAVIAITGGGQGLGRCMATFLAGKGAKLALIDLSQEKLDETVELCKQAGGDARAYICNVAKEDQVVATFDQIVKDFGGIDGLVNNAGILRDALLVKGKDGVIE